MANAVVLGAGMVGSEMARDLAAPGDVRVTLVDQREAALAAAAARAPSIATRVVDLSDPSALCDAIAGADVVLGALSSRLGYRVLEAIAREGKPYCDISFMAEDARDHQELARSTGAVVIVDCGVAPGLSNLLAGFATQRLTECRLIEIFVGGLPVERRWPFEYKAAFAPSDVIEEYTRPSRVVENGVLIVKEALTEPERVEFRGVGSLEAFNTDGLRSLVDTLSVPNMREKTLRYPGHRALMEAFRATGLFSESPILVNGHSVVPRDVTSTLMFPKWTYEPGEEDFTVLRVAAEGNLDGAPVRLTWDLFDRYDRATQATSMARTTAFPCTTVARMVLDGTLTTPGVHPPELLAKIPGVPERILEALRQRGIQIKESVTAR